MEEIKVVPLEDLETLNELRIDTYPAFASPSERENMVEKLRKIQTEHPYPLYGYYRNGHLLGSMRLFDFSMNLYGKKTLVGGLGSVAVNLLHKKEHIAKKLVGFFLEYYRNKGASLTFLYAFRPDFYKKMGFGYGTRIYDYQVSPTTFPRGKSKDHLTFLNEEDAPQWVSCHNRIAAQNHGMIEKTKEDYRFFLNDPSKKFIGYKKNDKIQGYMVFSPNQVNDRNVLTTHFVIHEWVYETTEVLQEFMTFLHSQADQFERIEFQTQEEDFYYLLDDPRNHTGNLIPPLFHESHTVGLGMMPRIINTSHIIQEIQHRVFGEEALTIQFHIEDDFLNETSSVTVIFEDGFCSLSSEEADVAININIANYSSLLFGSVTFQSLYAHGLVSLSDTYYADRLIGLFGRGVKPVCTLSF